MVEELQLLLSLWPLAIGFITLVIILAKMHSAIEVINEKIKVLFDHYSLSSRDDFEVGFFEILNFSNFIKNLAFF